MKLVSCGKVGVEVQGIDLSKKITASEIQDLEDAWYRHGVLVFRGQKLSDDELLAF